MDTLRGDGLALLLLLLCSAVVVVGVGVLLGFKGPSVFVVVDGASGRNRRTMSARGRTCTEIRNAAAAGAELLGAAVMEGRGVVPLELLLVR